MLPEEFLKPLGMSQADAARKMRISSNRLNELIRKKRGGTARLSCGSPPKRGVRAHPLTPSYPTFLPASSSKRVTAAVADEAPVPSRVTSPWTSGFPPPSRTRRGDHERMASEVSQGWALLPRQLVTTRHDQHSIRREQR